MNETFITDAFTEEESANIIETTINADRNPDCSTNPGNNTNDKVFLLSINEVNQYFTSNGERKINATEYAKNNGAFTKDSGAVCWLRSPGDISLYAALVLIDGSVDTVGRVVDSDNITIRPALWLDISNH